MSDHDASRRIKNHLCGCESQGGLSSPMYVSSAPFHVSPGYPAWLRRRKTDDGGLTGVWRIRPRARRSPAPTSSRSKSPHNRGGAIHRLFCRPRRLTGGTSLAAGVMLALGAVRYRMSYCVAAQGASHATHRLTPFTPGNRMGSIRHSVFRNGPSVHVSFPVHRLA